MHITRVIPWTLLAICLLAACRSHSSADAIAASRSSQGIPPREALSTFELEPGFQIELVASEPLIADPVDMEIDEYGRLYVVEMHGYPLDKSGTGIIKLLSDTNGDGEMDKSTVFADGLTLPNSVMRWKKGILITDAPHVLYLEDQDNDGKADIRDTLLTGFALSNPQHNLNTPLLGMDNWIYLGHEGAVSTHIYQKEFGDTGTAIIFPGYAGPALPPNASGRSVRFKPDQHLLETTSSNTQFGHSFDPWGHHFLVGNSNHIFHEVMAADYLKRNPQLLVSDATQSNSDHNDAAEIFPITQNPEHQLLTDVGVITSACSITYYDGGIFPEPFNRASFVAEPVSNLIHADRIADKGASFVASRIHPTKEFLASTDAWFRPVNMHIGPDGALYVVDYYRQIIEHPEWMGEDVVKSGKLYNGHDMGRIYRISPVGTKKAAWTKGLTLGDASPEELVQHLSNKNTWWRMNAQRLLVDRKDQRAIPALQKMTQDPSALGRLHALWTLEGMGALQPELVMQALKDPVAGVRENAVKLSERFIQTSPTLVKSLLNLQRDPDAKVRFQLLCTLGSVQTPEALQARNSLLYRDLGDPWVQVAALTGSSSQTAALLQDVLKNFKASESAYASLVRRLSSMAGASESDAMVHALISKAMVRGGEAETAWQAPLLEGLAEGIEERKSSFQLTASEELSLVETVFEHPSDNMQSAAFSVLEPQGIQNGELRNSTVARAMNIAANREQPESKRLASIKLLAIINPAGQKDLFKKLISPGEESGIQIAALRAFSAVPDTSSTAYLLSVWPALTPQVQHEAMNSFLESDDRISMLLHALETGKVQTSSVGWNRSVHLMAQDNLKLREKARALLTAGDKDREKINQQYKQALLLKGDADKGKELFKLHCSSCHMIRGNMGVRFGPDLGTVHNWSADAILANIISPNLSISSGYDLWSAETKNGESFQGIISSETATAISMMNAGRETRTIKRSDISSLKALNMSSMPTGLEKQINQQEMANLLAYLTMNK